MSTKEEDAPTPNWFDDLPYDFIMALVNELRGEILKIERSTEFIVSEQKLKASLRNGEDVDFINIINNSAQNSHHLLDLAVKYVKTHQK